MLLIDGPVEARAAARKLVKDGVEWIKTYPSGDAAAAGGANDQHALCMDLDEMKAVADTAHNHGLKVTGHCRATQAIKNALLAKYDCIEHATFMTDEALDMLLASNTPVVHALQFEKASATLGGQWGLSQAVIDGHRETLEAGMKSAQMILKAGGRMGMGGDYGFAWTPHGTYADELTFFVQDVGFTPLEVITCATRTGAEIIGREKEFGSLEAGKLADILIVDGDVLADISSLADRKKFIAVMQGGIVKAGQLA
jgi:imidazolonepropionase-like amidohydrolase